MKNDLIKKETEIFPITKYNSKLNEKNAVSFAGSPLQHPNDKEKFILISNPLSDHTQFFEFYKKDVLFVENLSSILSKKGESIHMSRIWIKSGVIALKYEPFIVGKTNEVIDKIKMAMK